MSPEAISIVSAMFTTLIIILLLALPISVLYIVCQWHLFVKAGEPGWKCLVPIFNFYTAYNLFWNTGWFIASLVIAAISFVISNGISSSDDITIEACEFIKSCPNIKAILAGHIHGEPIDDEIIPGLFQYTVGTDSARRITVI